MEKAIEYYNGIARKYDSRYQTEQAQTEDRMLKKLTAKFSGKNILDVGCGTGHFLTIHHEINARNYIGLEPCDAMRDVSLEKHKKHIFRNGSAESITEQEYKWADIVYYGYGAASYSCLKTIITNFLVNAKNGTGLFVMLYRTGAELRIESPAQTYSFEQIKTILQEIGDISYSIKRFMSTEYLNGKSNTPEAKGIDDSYWLVLKVYKQETGADVTEQEMRYFVQRNNWTNAKSYETATHEYVVKGKLTTDEQRQFERIVMFIRRNGYKEKFGKQTYVYYDLDGHKYWTMGAPLYQTIILNRAKIKTNESR